jgi:hypothetical protein
MEEAASPEPVMPSFENAEPASAFDITPAITDTSFAFDSESDADVSADANDDANFGGHADAPAAIAAADTLAAFTSQPKRMSQQVTEFVSKARVSIAGSIKTLVKELKEKAIPSSIASEEAPELRVILRAFQASAVEIREAAIKARAMLEAERALISTERHFSDAIAKLGSHSKTQDQEQGQTVQTFVPLALQLQSRRAALAKKAQHHYYYTHHQQRRYIQHHHCCKHNYRLHRC